MGERIASVRFSGHHRVSDADLLYILNTLPETRLNLSDVRRDLRNLFATDEFDDIQVDAEPGPDGLIVTFYLRERPLITAVEFMGNEEIDDEALDEVATIERFIPRDWRALAQSQRRLLEHYRGEGFYLAQISFSLEDAGEGLRVLRVDIEEGPRVETLAVRFIGNEALSDALLQRWMLTRPPHPIARVFGDAYFNPSPLAEDLERLKLLYNDHGHLDARLSTPHVMFDRSLRSVVVTIQIEEGPVYSIAEIKHDELLSAEPALLASLELRRGDVFKASRAITDMSRIRRHYQREGYPDVRPNLRYEKDLQPGQRRGTLIVTYDVNKGVTQRIGRVEIRGNEHTADSVLRDRLPIAEQDRFDYDKVSQIRPRLMALGLFDEVHVETSPAHHFDLQDITVTVVERDSFHYNAGGTVGAETLMGSLQLRYQNILGYGSTAAIAFSASFERLFLDVRYMDPHLFGSALGVGVDFFRFDLLYDDFSRSGIGGTLTLSYPLLDALKVELRYRIEDVEVTAQGRVNGGWSVAGQLFRSGLLSTLSLRLAYDDRDRTRSPAPGLRASVGVEWADDSAGSEVEFTEVDARAQWGVELGAGLLLRLSASTGFISDWNADGPVPAIERYFLGGAGTVRGFVPRTLAPSQRAPVDGSDPLSATTEVIAGGTFKLAASTELEFPLIAPWNLRGVVFFDVGNAFDSAIFKSGEVLDVLGEPSETSLRTAAGVGLRWNNPSLPLRLEWGFPLAPEADEGSPVVVFTVGFQ